MRFDDFCELVPRASEKLKLTPSAPIAHVKEGLTEFVAPQLSPRLELGQCSRPMVVVVSAAGAVGKSTLAMELASRSRIPYWDLAQYGVVGRGTLWGALKESLGVLGLSKFSEGLSAGSQALIVDALDEARVKTLEDGFEDFVKDIADTARESPGLSFVLFGRNQIAETTWLLLEDAGIKADFYAIDPFTREEAETFIDLRISKISSEAAARIDLRSSKTSSEAAARIDLRSSKIRSEAAARIKKHADPYLRARALLLDRLEVAIAGSQPGAKASEEASSFVGYAPVLRTVAELLADETNFEALETRFRDRAGGPIGLLCDVMDWILGREQTYKLGANIKPALEAPADEVGWSDWESLYTHTEQKARLLSALLQQPYAPPTRLPGRLDALYEDQLKVFLPEHPFLREHDSVFTSYLFAWSLVHGRGEATERHLAERDYKPSRLVADFYFELRRSNPDHGLLPHGHVGLLYDSLVAGESSKLAVRATLDGDVDADGPGPYEVDGELEILDLTTMEQDEPEATSYTFTTSVHENDVISFRRHLRDATIVVPCVLELGAGQDEFMIGPSVAIRADTLRVFAAALIAGGRTEKRQVEQHDDGVALEANAFESLIAQRPTDYVALSVTWPGCKAFPWSDFAAPGELTLIQDDRLRRAYQRFKRIIMTLRSHSKGSLARFRGKIEHARVLKNEIGEAMLNKLVTDKILYLSGSFYHLSQERAHELTGTSWVQLRKGVPSDRLVEYLDAFVRAHEDLFE